MADIRSFQEFVTTNYVGPAGLFGVTPGAIPPTWTVEELGNELMGEWQTQPKNFNGVWFESPLQSITIILSTCTQYALLLAECLRQNPSSPTQEWTDWVAENPPKVLKPAQK